MVAGQPIRADHVASASVTPQILVYLQNWPNTICPLLPSNHPCQAIDMSHLKWKFVLLPTPAILLST